MLKFLTITALCLFLTACPKKECQISGGYDFELTATLSPAQSTYQIGDTISIESVFPNELLDNSTERWYTLNDFRFFPVLFVSEISTSQLMKEGLINLR